MNFSTRYDDILAQIGQVDPLRYAVTRNFTDGAVTRLSPYISRGVISVRQVLQALDTAGYKRRHIEKFIQELAWREYWQQVWIAHGEGIDEDLRQHQPLASRPSLPQAIRMHSTGIEAIDKGIASLYQTGYMHNHLRMYVASLSCNIAGCHWKIPARWMYYHLLDADWASNALSWQWVCGANSSKLYFANQENINRYCHTLQKGTYLDIAYEDFAGMKTPAELQEVSVPEFHTPLPVRRRPDIDPDLPVLLFNFYNLDPLWRSGMKANRILLLEPSVFEKYPVSQKSIDFCMSLALENIPGIQVWTAEFSELKKWTKAEIYFREHPLNRYTGIEDARDWMCRLNGNYPSFFSYWKQAKKALDLV